MTQKHNRSRLVCALLLGLACLGAAEKVKLPERFEKWLGEEVGLIITPKERDVFLKLQTDRERDIFVQAFWNQRDPTPGTPANEFRTEHYRRLGYANDHFGRGTPRPGWMTDQGRVYIILGPPRNIESYDSVSNVYPTEIWFYQVDPSTGLPAAFNVIFFKKEGMGEYILYSPVDHGPQSLIATSMQDFRDDQDAYLRLRQLEPSLARQTLSLIPGETALPGFPSLASSQLLRNIFYAPLKQVNDTYAEALLKYKDTVEVEYTANYVDCDALVQVARSERGAFVVHYSVEPRRLSVSEIRGKLVAHFQLNGRLADSSGRTIYQFDKEFPLEFDAAEIQDVKATSLAMQDMFPCRPGSYRFDLLIKNAASKEFSSFAADLVVPDLPSTKPLASPLLIGYGSERTQAAAAELVPFSLAGRQILVQAKKTFVPRDTLWVVFQIYSMPDEWRPGGQVRFVYAKEGAAPFTQTRKISEILTGETLVEEQPLASFAPGYYDLRVTVVDPQGKEFQVPAARFEVSPLAGLPRPRIMAKVLRAQNSPEWDYDLGVQALNSGDRAQGNAWLEKAFRSEPQDARFGLGYAQSLFLLGQYAKVKDVLQAFLERPDRPPEMLMLLGRSSHALGQFQEAISFYNEYLGSAGTNLEIMNLVGTCYFQLGDRARALATWEKSLAINPKQDELQKLVDSLKKK